MGIEKQISSTKTITLNYYNYNIWNPTAYYLLYCTIMYVTYATISHLLFIIQTKCSSIKKYEDLQRSEPLLL